MPLTNLPSAMPTTKSTLGCSVKLLCPSLPSAVCCWQLAGAQLRFDTRVHKQLDLGCQTEGNRSQRADGSTATATRCGLAAERHEMTWQVSVPVPSAGSNGIASKDGPVSRNGNMAAITVLGTVYSAIIHPLTQRGIMMPALRSLASGVFCAQSMARRAGHPW